jgi:kynureninase
VIQPGPARQQQLHERAAALDAADALAGLRARFAIPRDAQGRELVYLCGHSLGLAPHAARRLVLEELDDWERLGVLGHEQARRDWIGYAGRLQAPLAALVGASPAEVVAMNSLSVNLHLLLAGFYRPRGQRNRILVEAGAFPSDRHVVRSQIAWHGLDPDDCLVEVAPAAGGDLVDEQALCARIAAEGERLALVLWPGVQYRTGQAFALAPIVRAAHAVGARVGFDLAHSVGNVELALHDSGADFAAWCSYKYLNAGPGAIGAAFVHERHASDASLPRLSGWWSHDAATRFGMSPRLALAPGADGWQVSNPPILSAAPLLASLALFDEAGMPALRRKSLALTGLLAEALQSLCGDDVALVTPAEPQRRGCQLSLRVAGGRERAHAAWRALLPLGVVADWREPDTIRVAPVPLYNRHAEVVQAAGSLAQALAQLPA